MSKKNVTESNNVYGADLERWRLENGLSKPEAAEAFGIQPVKWDKLTNHKALLEPIHDPIIVMLLVCYTNYPDSVPIKRPPKINDFFQSLGLSLNEPTDLAMFATLIGRSAPSVYRILMHDGNPGRPVMKWLEALIRLKQSSSKTDVDIKKLMIEIVKLAAEKQNVQDVLINGWEGWTKRRDNAK